MKRVLLVLLLAVTACSFSGSDGDPGAGPGDGDGSGSGKDPSIDMDDDGHDNDVDNCPTVANADQADADGDKVGDACDNCPALANPPIETMGLGLVQRDHDGDGRGDACDLCPHLASDSDTDGDGDGIGAACDPNDAVKNPPAEFNGFYDPPSAAQWEVAPSAGVLADWEHVQTEDKRLWWTQKTLDGGRHQLLRSRPNIDEVRVDTAFRIHAIQPAMNQNTLRSAGISYGFEVQAGTSYYFSCSVRHNTTNQTNELTVGTYAGDDANVNDASNTSWSGAPLDQDIRVVADSIRRTGTGGGDSTLLCDGNSDPDNDHSLTRNTQYRPPGKVGLRTFGMTASFDYIFIVDKAVAP